MRKIAAALAALLLLWGLSACGRQTGPASSSPALTSEPLKLETLRLELTRGDELPAAALMAAARTLPDALKAALADQSVEVGAVEVTVGASPAATAQALREGGVDLAVLPGEAFVKVGEAAVPLLTAQERTALPGSADAADWLGVETGWSDELSGGVRMLILAGPSDYGRQLAARAASGNSLTWDELNRAVWLIDPKAEGMASVWLADNYEGNTLSDLDKASRGGVADDGGRSVLSALAKAEADVAVIPADARIDLAGIWREELKRPKGIFEETAVVGVTEKYYQTVLAARPGNALLTGEQFCSALAAAMTETCSGQDGIAAALGGVLSAPLTGGDLDGMRRLATLEG